MSKKRWKQARAKVRTIQAANDAEVRSSWGRPPLWLCIVGFFKPARLAKWYADREADHLAKQAKAFKKTAHYARGLS